MLLISYGTRPEYIKIKPLIDYLWKADYPFVVCRIRQHENLVDNCYFDFELKVRDRYSRLDCLVESALHWYKWKYPYTLPDITHVLVQGDTTSAMAMALTSFHAGLKVIHMEAGLRSCDDKNPWPEEVNRKLISQLADIHLCPTHSNMVNLINENVTGKKYVVGNTSIDSIKELGFQSAYGDHVVITLHRRENWPIMDKWFTQLNLIAGKSKLKFIFPMHPGEAVQKHRAKLKNIQILDPIDHEGMAELISGARLVITDSGGIQEECSYYKKICLVCRTTTERVESLGKSTILIKHPEELPIQFGYYEYEYKINWPCPYGDGRASEQIYEILKDLK